jgi:hypothetical protein
MRFRGCPGALVILSALAVPAATSSAQGPAAPTTFDGKYVGTAAPTYGYDAAFCSGIRSIDMTITGGQVRVHELLSSGNWGTYGGNINAAGEVSASRQMENNYWLSLSGTIHDNVFTGQRLDRARWGCQYSVQMAPAPAPTTPFDGWYRGVSREVSGSGSNEHHCNPVAVVPAIPLTITNGVVGIPGEWWQGTVSPQGIVVMGNPKLSRVEAQIDRQGTIRGQYSGQLPSDLLARIGGIGGGDINCIIKYGNIIKFVWQKE